MEASIEKRILHETESSSSCISMIGSMGFPQGLEDSFKCIIAIAFSDLLRSNSE